MEKSRRNWKTAALATFFVFVAAGIAAPFVFDRPRHDTPFMMGEAAYLKGDYSKAAEIARTLVQAAPDDPFALRLLARSTARLGRDESSGALYQRYRSLKALDLKAEDLLLEASRLGRAGNLTEALELLKAARLADPEHPETLEALARLLTKEQKLDEALQAADDLAKQPGYEVSGGLMAGILHVQMNDPEGAIATFQTAFASGDLSKFASDPSAFQKAYARSLLRTSRPDQAQTLLEDVLKLRSDDAEAEWLLSRALLQEGKINEAAEARERSGNYGPDHLAEAEPASYVGEKACAKCHSKIFEDSKANRHTQSYFRGPDLLELPLPDGPLSDPSDPKATHTYKKIGERIEAETRVDGELFRAVVDYAFGTPDRYVTMTKREPDGSYRACRLSHYQDSNGAKGWDLSAGDDLDPEHADRFLGRPVAVQSGVMRCLYCHTTNTRGGKNRVGPETADRAIGCERCHGPGSHHLAAVAAGFPDLAIANVKKDSAEGVTKLCADCHNLNPPEVVESTPKTDSAWVRSPGITLTWSRCYEESGGSLTCLTCHDPHKPSRDSIETSERACLSCHKSGNTERARSICSVNPVNDCLRCHMPAVPNKSLHLSLTDHFIRVRNDLKSGAVIP